MGVIWGLVRLLLHLLYLNLKTKEDQSSPIVKGSRDHLQRHQTMLHILSLFLLPLLVSSAEAKGAFIYLCLGEGCSGWEIAPMVISILFSTCVLVSACRGCCRAMKQRKMEEEDSKTSSNIKETV